MPLCIVVICDMCVCIVVMCVGIVVMSVVHCSDMCGFVLFSEMCIFVHCCDKFFRIVVICVCAL